MNNSITINGKTYEALATDVKHKCDVCFLTLECKGVDNKEAQPCDMFANAMGLFSTYFVESKDY